MMNPIQTNNCNIYFNADCYTAINSHLSNNTYSKLFIIVDANTHTHCLPYFLSKLKRSIDIEIIKIKAGEKYKTIDTCVTVWNTLSNLNADRKSLVINLGGGVVTDLGGFVACTFKRGLNYINVPTSLLAMVDASVGGKTGVDLGALKNQIGVINTGEMVLIDTHFLNTLPKNQLRSGLAEMLKHGLIQDENYWQELVGLDELDRLDVLIYKSVVIKNNVIEADLHENGLRKTLNFGHTLGHAIESYFLEHANKPILLHGEAIAIGMILACFISKEMLGFSNHKLQIITRELKRIYGHIEITNTDINAILNLLKFDKKNEFGNILFVLLEYIGVSKINCKVSTSTIIKAFNFYSTFKI